MKHVRQAQADESVEIGSVGCPFSRTAKIAHAETIYQARIAAVLGEKRWESAVWPHEDAKDVDQPLLTKKKEEKYPRQLVSIYSTVSPWHLGLRV
jgi:hypothetical protein